MSEDVETDGELGQLEDDSNLGLGDEIDDDEADDSEGADETSLPGGGQGGQGDDEDQGV